MRKEMVCVFAAFVNTMEDIRARTKRTTKIAKNVSVIMAKRSTIIQLSAMLSTAISMSSHALEMHLTARIGTTAEIQMFVQQYKEYCTQPHQKQA